MEIFPNVRPALLSEINPGQFVAGEFRGKPGLALVVLNGENKNLLLLTPDEFRFQIIPADQNSDVICFDNELRIYFDANSISRSSGFNEPDCRGFMFFDAGGSRALVCAENNGFELDNVLVKIDHWMIVDRGPRSRLGTGRWEVQAYDNRRAEWAALYRNVS